MPAQASRASGEEDFTDSSIFLNCFFHYLFFEFGVFCVLSVFWCFLVFVGVFDLIFGFLWSFSVGCTHFRRKLLLLDDFWAVFIF